MKQGETTESQVKGEIHEWMINNEKHRSPEFPEMENIGNSGVSRNRITSKYTYLGNSPEFQVVLEPWERILTDVWINTDNDDRQSGTPWQKRL